MTLEDFLKELSQSHTPPPFKNPSHESNAIDTLIFSLLLKMIDHDIKVMELELKRMKHIREQLKKGNFIIGKEYKCQMNKD